MEEEETADAPMEEDLPPPPPPEPQLDVGDDLPPIPPEGFQPQQSDARESRGPLFAWVALLVVVTGTLTFGYFKPRTMVNMYQPMQQVYDWVGMSVDILGYGLELDQPVSDRERSEGIDTLIVSGNIKNTLDDSIMIPKLRGALLNTQKEEMYVWMFDAANKEALPGETVEYESRIQNVPAGAVSLKVTFISEEEIMAMENEKMPMTEGEDKMDKDKSAE